MFIDYINDLTFVKNDEIIKNNLFIYLKNIAFIQYYFELINRKRRFLQFNNKLKK